MALICLSTIIVSSWYIIKASKSHGLVQVPIGNYPFWMKQITAGRWPLYLQEQYQEDIVGVGPTGLITENIKIKRYYLDTNEGVVELTSGNFREIILAMTKADQGLYQALVRIGFTFEKVPSLIQACNNWSLKKQQIDKPIQ